MKITNENCIVHKISVACSEEEFARITEWIHRQSMDSIRNNMSWNGRDGDTKYCVFEIWNAEGLFKEFHFTWGTEPWK